MRRKANTHSLTHSLIGAIQFFSDGDIGDVVPTVCFFAQMALSLQPICRLRVSENKPTIKGKFSCNAAETHCTVFTKEKRHQSQEGPSCYLAAFVASHSYPLLVSLSINWRDKNGHDIFTIQLKWRRPISVRITCGGRVVSVLVCHASSPGFNSRSWCYKVFTAMHHQVR